jgi:hypothetical protein
MTQEQRLELGKEIARIIARHIEDTATALKLCNEIVDALLAADREGGE